MPDLNRRYTEILAIVSNDDFYDKPDDKKIENVRSFFKEIREALLKHCEHDYALLRQFELQVNLINNSLKKMKDKEELAKEFPRIQSDFKLMLPPDINGTVFDTSNPTQLHKTLIVQQITALRQFVKQGVPAAVKDAYAQKIQSFSGIPFSAQSVFHSLNACIAFLKKALCNTPHKNILWNVGGNDAGQTTELISNSPFPKRTKAQDCVTSLGKAGIHNITVKKHKNKFYIIVPLVAIRAILPEDGVKTNADDKKGGNIPPANTAAANTAAAHTAATTTTTPAAAPAVIQTNLKDIGFRLREASNNKDDFDEKNPNDPYMMLLREAKDTVDPKTSETAINSAGATTGMTSLHFAAQRGNFKKAEALIAGGALKNKKDNKERTAYEVAKIFWPTNQSLLNLLDLKPSLAQTPPPTPAPTSAQHTK